MKAVAATCAGLALALPLAAPAQDQPAAPAWTDFYGDAQPESAPKPVRRFIMDAQACTHFAGEEPYDRERAAFLAKMTRKHCRNLDARKEALAQKHKPDEVILALLDKAWDNDRAAMRLAPPRPALLPDALGDRTPATTESALASTAGAWQGKLEYRDYQSNQWFGLPMKVTIMAQPDGVTMVRTAEYDDGPQTGLVWITTVEQLDPVRALINYSQFRKGREPDGGTGKITRFVSQGPLQWTLVIEERRRDGDGFAMVRETTMRDGDVMVALKEVDPEGDDTSEWVPRNRTTLTRVKARGDA